MIKEIIRQKLVGPQRLILPNHFRSGSRILKPSNGLIANNSLLKNFSYTGPPVILEGSGTTNNATSASHSFAQVPDIGDLILFCVTAGTTNSAPTSIPSGFSTHVTINSAGVGGSFFAGCYYAIADGVTNSFSFTWAAAGTVGVAGYVIRYHNVINTAITNALAVSGTTINTGNGPQSFPLNSLGVAFATTGNTSASITMNQSYNNFVNVSSPVTPTRQALMGSKAYLTATSQAVNASWTTNRTAISFLFYITSSNPV